VFGAHCVPVPEKRDEIVDKILKNVAKEKNT
jgi:hypothetical protein